MQCPYHISMSTSTSTFPTACVISATHLISPKPLVNFLVGNLPNFCPPKKPSRNSSSWWLNHPPLKSMLVKMGSFLQILGEQKKYLKPPPSLGWKDPRASSQSPSSKHFTRWWHRVTSSWTRTPRTKNASNGASGKKLKKIRHEKKTVGGCFCWVSKNRWFIKLLKRKTSFSFIPNQLSVSEMQWLQLCWIRQKTTSFR